MNNNLVINDENFSRTKKKLKKSLEKEGVNLSLSKVGELLAQSLGFQNVFDIQQNLPSKSNSDNLTKKYLDDIVYIYETFSKYLNFDIIEIKKVSQNPKFQTSNIGVNYQQNYIDNINYLVFMKKTYLNEFYYDILSGEDESILQKLNEFSSFSLLRHICNDLYKITGRETYKKFYTLMDDYHNLEQYYLIENNKRSDFWIQPVNAPTDKGFYYQPTYDVKEKIKFDLKKVINEIRNNNLNSLTKLPLNKSIIIFGKTGSGKTTAIETILKSQKMKINNRVIGLEESKEFIVYDHMNMKEEKDIIHDGLQQKTLFSVYAPTQHDLLKRLIDEKFDFSKVSVLLEAKRVYDGSYLYTATYVDDIDFEELTKWFQYLKNRE